MSNGTPFAMTEEEIDRYRSGVAALIAECLARISRFSVERDADADAVPERTLDE